MKRIDGTNNLPNANGPGKAGYQDYNAATGQAGTIPNASTLNAWQEELAGYMETMGLTLNPADSTQLYQAISAHIATQQRGMFAAEPTSPASMVVTLTAGFIPGSGTVTPVGSQSTAAFVAPVGNPRIDRIVVSRTTGLLAVIAGTPAATPVPPAVPGADVPIAQVLLTPSTTAIPAALITDERDLPPLGLGALAFLGVGANLALDGAGNLTLAGTPVLTGLTVGGSAAVNAVSFQQATPSSCSAGGTADALTGSFTPAITSLAGISGVLSLMVRAASANVTTTPTFTPNSGVVAPAVIVKGNGIALAPGDIAGAGHWIELQYDPTLAKWVLLNPATGVSPQVPAISSVALGTSTGSANAQVFTPTTAITSYVTQTVGYVGTAGYANTGAMTVNISGLGPVAVYKDGPSGPTALTGGEIQLGQIFQLRYDGTHFQLGTAEAGSAALANASSSTGVVAAVYNTVTAGHLPVFKDTSGTVQDGGVAGTAANKNTGTTVIDPGTGALEVASPFVGGAAPITGATRTFAVTDRGQVVRRANSGTAMTDTLPGTSSAVLAAGWWGAVINTDPLANLTIAVGSGAALDNGTPLILGPLQSVMIGSDGTNYWSERGAGRIQLRANLTLYVNAGTGNDTTNTGLTSGSAFATLNRAYSLLQAQYDLNGYVATIQLAPGTYAGATFAAPVIGSAGPASVVILGNTGSPASYVIQGSSSIAINANSGAMVTLSGVQIGGSTTTYGILAMNGALVSFGAVIFGACSSYQIMSQSFAVVTATASYSITAGSNVHLTAFAQGRIYINSGITVTVTGTPAFSSSFASTADASVITCSGVTYSGSATGIRYAANSNSVIETAGSGASYFPGNSAGSTATGGQYI